VIFEVLGGYNVVEAPASLRKVGRLNSGGVFGQNTGRNFQEKFVRKLEQRHLMQNVWI